MKPDNFLALAAQLVSFNTEAAFRTAISRAYYAAFHAACALIKEVGVGLPIGPESHVKVRLCLLESGEPLAQQAGRSLEALRKLRNAADYELAAPVQFDKRTAAESIDDSRRIFDRLKRCREQPVSSRFRTKVRDYAANVLRLPVT